MNRFYSVYKDRMNLRYKEHINKKYLPFLQVIKAHVFAGATVMEMGCGAGNISRALHLIQPDLNHILVDIDPNMLRLANENMSDVSKNYTVQEVDITKPNTLDKVDLIHSHGVLEHFNDKQIQTIIKNQLKLSSNLIHYVPSAKYKKPSFGDERLLTPEHWKRICNPDQIIEFNNGFDLILRWY